MDSLLNIGTGEEAVAVSKDAILEILAARADQKTIRVALKAFMESVKVENVMVAGCFFGSAKEED